MSEKTYGILAGFAELVIFAAGTLGLIVATLVLL